MIKNRSFELKIQGMQQVDFNIDCALVTLVGVYTVYPMVSKTQSKLQLHLSSIQF